ncbi:Actin family like protein [Aduncisulcus paluster]|uniref:Actin family like protein n=1 Tax=Aduncisulcus paluster TaxID=2918883 RepID=A0ABQ5K5B7_9EUKA|nr:Actin family like protein [Aduncisulcus paluster]
MKKKVLVLLDPGQYSIKVGIPGGNSEKPIFNIKTIYTDDSLLRITDSKIHKGSNLLGLGGDLTWWIGDDAISCYASHKTIRARDFLTATPPISFEDFVERLIQHIFYSLLRIDCESVSVCIIKRHSFPMTSLKTLIEVLFDQCGCHSISVLPADVLALYSLFQPSSSKAPSDTTVSHSPSLSFLTQSLTGIVVNIGDSCVDIIPIYAGYVIENAIKRLDIGGNDCTSIVLEALKIRKVTKGRAKHLTLAPSTPGPSKKSIIVPIEPFSSLPLSEIARVLKENFSAVCPSAHSIFSKYSETLSGTRAECSSVTCNIGMEMLLCHDLFFYPKELRNPSSFKHKLYRSLFKHSMVDSCISAANDMVQKDTTFIEPCLIPSSPAGSSPDLDDRDGPRIPALVRNVLASMSCEKESLPVICGGPALVPGFAERIETEVKTMLKAMQINVLMSCTRVVKVDNPEHLCYSGACKYVLDERFKEQCVKRTEYNKKKWKAFPCLIE